MRRTNQHSQGLKLVHIEFSVEEDVPRTTGSYSVYDLWSSDILPSDDTRHPCIGSREAQICSGFTLPFLRPFEYLDLTGTHTLTVWCDRRGIQSIRSNANSKGQLGNLGDESVPITLFLGRGECIRDIFSNSGHWGTSPPHKHVTQSLLVRKPYKKNESSKQIPDSYRSRHPRVV